MEIHESRSRVNKPSEGRMLYQPYDATAQTTPKLYNTVSPSFSFFLTYLLIHQIPTSILPTQINPIIPTNLSEPTQSSQIDKNPRSIRITPHVLGYFNLLIILFSSIFSLERSHPFRTVAWQSNPEIPALKCRIQQGRERSLACLVGRQGRRMMIHCVGIRKSRMVQWRMIGSMMI